MCMPCGDVLRGISESIVIITMQTSSVSCIAYRGRSRGKVQGVPPPLGDDLSLSNTTGILQKNSSWYIGVEVKHETRLKNLC